MTVLTAVALSLEHGLLSLQRATWTDDEYCEYLFYRMGKNQNRTSMLGKAFIDFFEEPFDM